MGLLTLFIDLWLVSCCDSVGSGGLSRGIKKPPRRPQDLFYFPTSSVGGFLLPEGISLHSTSIRHVALLLGLQYLIASRLKIRREMAWNVLSCTMTSGRQTVDRR